VKKNYYYKKLWYRFQVKHGGFLSIHPNNKWEIHNYESTNRTEIARGQDLSELRKYLLDNMLSKKEKDEIKIKEFWNRFDDIVNQSRYKFLRDVEEEIIND